uniref:Uncharacterized protein n=1 Tax=Cyanoptyche gloeocystis TaxID=77922 RepID=A0A7S2NQY0_9EUKA
MEDVVKYPTLEGVRLHHYRTKSMHEWTLRRVGRVRASGLPPFQPNMSRYEDSMYNEVEDTSALRFSPALRARLQSRASSLHSPH